MYYALLRETFRECETFLECETFRECETFLGCETFRERETFLERNLLERETFENVKPSSTGILDIRSVGHIRVLEGAEFCTLENINPLCSYL